MIAKNKVHDSEPRVTQDSSHNDRSCRRGLHRSGNLALECPNLVTTPSMEFRTTADRKTVAVLYDGHAAEISTQIDAFAKLEAGCEALAQP